MGDYTVVALFVAIGIAFVVLTLGFSWFVRPIHRREGDKVSTYECGEVPVGPAWSQLRVGYYIYLLIFVLFDVEVLFVFPWALALKSIKSISPAMAVVAVVDMFIFVGILAVGLAYAWRKGVLKWE